MPPTTTAAPTTDAAAADPTATTSPEDAALEARSPHYAKLRAVARLNSEYRDDYIEEGCYQPILDALENAVARLKLYLAETGLTGDSATSLGALIDDLVQAIAGEDEWSITGALQTSQDARNAARSAMYAAREAFRKLSPELLSGPEQIVRSLVDALSTVTLPVIGEVSASKYFDRLEQENNLERETAAKKALTVMNQECRTQAERPRVGIMAALDDSNETSDSGGADGASGPTAWGDGFGFGDGAAGGPADMVRSPLDDDPFWPAGFRVSSVAVDFGGGTADGKVTGGYVPAPVTDVDDPKWNQAFRVPGIDYTGGMAGGGLGGAGFLMPTGASGSPGSSTKAKDSANDRSTGGAGGLGGLSGAGDSGEGTGASGLGYGGAGAAAGALSMSGGRLASAFGLGGTGVADGGASGGGAGGPQIGTPSVGGSTAPVSGATAAAGAAAAGQAAPGPTAMGGMGMGGGAGGQDHGRKRKKFKVVRLDEEGAAVGPWDSALDAGSVDALQPLAHPDDDDF